MRWKFWKRLMLLGILLPLLLIGILIFILYQKQDHLVQGEIDALNKTHEGLIVIGDTHIAPFTNFPYISIKVDSVQIYESKEDNASLILDVADIYMGFNIWDIVNARYDIQKLLIEDGFFNIIKHKDGTINIENALAAPSEGAVEEEPLDIHLRNIELKNLDIHKLDEASQLDIETFIYWAKSGIKTVDNEIDAHIDTEFELNIIENQDTSFIKHKHFEFHTDVLYDELSGLLTIAPSGIRMENGDFKVHGNIETKKEMALDLHVNGAKPNFDMLIAFAPEDLAATLERYNNAGEFYFHADIVGPTANGQMPFVDVNFGASEAFLENIDVRKRVDNLGFKGHFTNGEGKSFESMEFSLEEFTSKLERGNFVASLFVKNFIEPDVELELNTDFNLNFLTQFFNLSYVENVSGNVKLDMRFHDIIDLAHPEKALNQLNQAYYSELTIENLHVESADLPVSIDTLNMHLAMSGERGVLDTFDLKMGATDLSLKGFVSDLPAIVHHTNIPVEAELEINSNLFDLSELTGFAKGDSSGIDEQIADLSLLLRLNSSARAITESKYLPEGVFVVERLYAQTKHFPHELHDIHGSFIIDSNDLEVADFTGYIDQSDFHFSGNLHNYGSLMDDTLSRAVKLNTPVEAELEMSSKLLDIAELTGFTNGDSTGIDEQMEDFSIQLKFNSTADGLTRYQYLPKGEFFIEGLHAQLKHYPHELHDFHVDILIDDQDLKIVDFTGFIDQSDFHFNGNIHDYGFWMKDTLAGDVKLDISLNADLLRLEDVFSYQGENYVPEDYRHEELDNLKLHLNSEMHYKNAGLHSIDVDLDQFDAKMHVHPMRFEDFSGRFHYEDEHVVIEKMHGKIGRTVFDVDMNYYLGQDESIKLRDNHFGLKANYIDFDQLFAFNTASPNQPKTTKTPTTTTEDVEAHSTAFNIYELPFTDMTFDLDVDHFIYHHIDLQNIHSRLRTTHDHYIYVDTMYMRAAGGQFLMSGYFNGSNPDRIYLKPKLKVIQADLDQLLFKYENFGQDEVLSDYVHGQLSADITGNIRVYPDMVPDLDQSEIHMDVELLNGRLENYEPVLMLSDYMGDKNLSNVRFDTLQNHMDITNGVLTIPSMTIESTLGHYELSGEHSMAGDLEYYIRIPWKIVRKSARNKLFGSKKTKDGQVGDDEIIEKPANKKVWYLNLRVKGTLDDYDIKLRKKRKKKKKKKKK
ncbi:MAG: AsmA-like C-terminal region-containing protein [Bacteroidota bacterium]